MPLPTLQSVPRIGTNEKPEVWAKRLSSFLEQHVTQFLLLSQRISLANGDNNNVDTQAGMYVHLVGPVGAFAVTGLGKGTEGRIVVLHNNSAGTLTIKNNNAGSVVGNKINTLTGADLSTDLCILVYSQKDLMWYVVNGSGGGTVSPGSGDDTLDWLGF